ncbi:uracil-xanthine permease family protein [Loigolactobacillus jiayinensis]|uniref:Uracil-xanthine permease family protein n=1 Tax=Loigolactobacillus jiayinensis TaxID=2486016 RepID=A0ABW1RBH6_9LACO|nr:nucleobase:cation symporter-2 family protein [Loigolactobacillus jiayinensis]
MKTVKNKNNGGVSDADMVFQLEGRPKFSIAFPLGLQHVLAMFAGNLAPMLIIAAVAKATPAETIVMVQAGMLISGLTTFVQLYPIKIGRFQIGSGLPIVMGTSFAFVPTASAAAAIGGIPAVLGGALVGSLSEGFIGLFYKYLKRFFTPLVIGSTLIAIGINLLGVGRDYFAGGAGAKDYGSWQNLTIAFSTFLFVIILQRFGKGVINTAALLFGLLFGYILAFFFGKVDLSSVSTASWATIPLPLHFMPTFDAQTIISFVIIYITVAMETIGNTSGITIAAFDRPATEKETSGSVLADAIGCAVASIFGAMPNTAFGQNVGIVSMTKVVNKWCIALGAGVLVICGFLPKLGSIFASIPNPVLGGALISVFAMITLNGIKMLAQAGFSGRNVTVLGITFALGIGFAGHADAIAGMPTWLKFIFEDSIAATTLVGIITNLVFPNPKKHEASTTDKVAGTTVK